MPERMMVKCPGCDGVVSVSPTGDEAKVACPKCSEAVYTRNAQGGEWWANVPVADPTVEKPVVDPVAPTTPEVPVVPTTHIVTPTRRTRSHSATDWFLGGVLASIFTGLLLILHRVILFEMYPNDPYSIEDPWGWIFFVTFLGICEECILWVHKGRVRVSGEEAANRNKRAFTFALLIFVFYAVLIIVAILNKRSIG